MLIKKAPTLLLAALACLLFSACSSTNPELLSHPNESNKTPMVPVSKKPHLIHINNLDRVVTLRNGEELEGYLITLSSEGVQTGVLKTLASRGTGKLRTADILEGHPMINDTIRIATEEEKQALSKIYRDAIPDEL